MYLIFTSILLNISALDPFDYEKAWQEVETLKSNGLPQDALAKTVEIYNIADNEGNVLQRTKATIYLSGFALESSEDGLLKADQVFKNELAKSKAPYVNIVHSYYAKFLRGYLDNNRYIISQRTEVADDNLLTMSTKTLIEKITNEYKASLMQPKELKLEIKAFSLLLNEYNEEGRLRKPDLYEVLADEALTYFISNQANDIDLTDVLSIDRSYFGSPEDFSKLKIDNSSSKGQVLQMFQDIIRHELENNKLIPLAHFDMLRLQYVHEQSTEKESDKYYETAIKNGIVNFKNLEISTEYQANLAQHYLNGSDDKRYSKSYAVCEDCIKKFPKANGAASCRSILDQIKNQELSINAEVVYLKDAPIKYRLTTRNLNKVYFKLIKNSDVIKEQMNGNYQNLKEIINAAKPIKIWSNDIENNKDFLTTQIDMTTDALPMGAYIMVASNQADFTGSFQYMTFQVSNLAYIFTSDDKGNYFLIVDRKSGAPVKDASVEFMEQKYDYQTQKYSSIKAGTGKSDKDGKVYAPGVKNTQFKLIVKKGSDVFDGTQYHYDREIYQRMHARESLELFTDRAIYRPGQTVYFKAIALNYDVKERPEIIPNRSVTLKLRDANGQEVNNVTLVTNEWGSASGSFALPLGRLTGQYYIESKSGNTSFRVEEYKRPTFEVEFDSVTQAYKLGDKINVSAVVKAFAGNGISNAKITYTVFRRTSMPYCYRWYGFPSNDKLVATGTVNADESGKFSIAFDAIDDQLNNFYPIYNYDIVATALDESGESQSQAFTISLSKKSLFIEENIPDVFDVNEKTEASLTVKNLAGIKVKESGNYTISKLKESNALYEHNVWGEMISYRPNPNQSNNKYAKLEVEKVVSTGKFTSNDKLPLSSLGVGIYKISATVNGDQADTLTEYFVVTDFKKKKFPASQIIHHITNGASYAVGDKLIFEMGTAIDKQNVYVVLSRSGKVIKQQWVKVAKNAKFEYLITDEDKGGLTIQYMDVYNNRTYTGNININVPWSEKELSISFENFRDKLLPGEQTDFKIKIAGNKKDKVQAEILAAMYDASLDQLQANYWHRILFPNNYSSTPLEAYYFGLAYGNELNYDWQNLGDNNEIEAPILPYLKEFESFSFMWYGGSIGGIRNRGAIFSSLEAPTYESASAAAPEGKKSKAKEEDFDGITVGDVNLESQNAGLPKEKKESPVITPRTNLKETVFFYPHLRTDKDGNVILSFKMNEALTKWKLMTFAHTKELATVYDERYIQTKKDLMIIANSPRFVREGDEIFFTARVSNLSDKDINAVANLDLKSYAKDVPLNQWISTTQSVNVTLKKGESKSVSWSIKVPKNAPDLINYTVSAVSGNYTDGEASILPVLSNRILVTESMSMYLKGNEKKTYEFTSLKNAPATQSPFKYTVEISSHPVWYAIQAMPYIMQQNNLSASQLATKYYVNGLSRYINSRYPQIQDVFTQWQNSGGEALKSNLEKNSELKNALLEETPWVLEAQNESTAKANIATLFDENTVKADIAQTLQSLSALQLPDGSYTWFPGGKGDYYTTLYVAEMLGKTSKIDASGEALNTAMPSLTYLDSDLLKQYNKLQEDYKKNKLKIEEYQPASEAINHLFVRSMFMSVPRQAESNVAYDFYYKQALKFWTKYDIYVQSLLGQVDFRNKGMTYNDIAKSIMQKSFKSDELGIYWNVGNGYRWYEMPIERHAAIMDFLNETNYEVSAIDQMKIWLLKNKQGNHWTTSKSTAAAIAALMLTRGPKQANLDNDLAVISKVGEVSLPGKADIQAGTAYYKKSWTSESIDKGKATIYMSNPNDNIAWGAAYYQYFEDVNNIKATNASPLMIEKQLYKEVMTSNGKTLVLVDAKNTLTPGDVLVSRIIVTVDRDMDYIHLKDLRASGLEPYNNISQYRWSGPFGYYESIRDLATHYYIDHLPKGKHVFESRQKVVHRGKYSGGLATIQSFYAPEFGGKTEGNTIEVK